MRYNTCYIERSAVREIVIGAQPRNAATDGLLRELLRKVDELDITTGADFETVAVRMRDALQAIANDPDTNVEAAVLAKNVLAIVNRT